MRAYFEIEPPIQSAIPIQSGKAILRFSSRTVSTATSTGHLRDRESAFSRRASNAFDRIRLGGGGERGWADTPDHFNTDVRLKCTKFRTTAIEKERCISKASVPRRSPRKLPRERVCDVGLGRHFSTRFTTVKEKHFLRHPIFRVAVGRSSPTESSKKKPLIFEFRPISNIHKCLRFRIPPDNIHRRLWHRVESRRARAPPIWKLGKMAKKNSSSDRSVFGFEARHVDIWPQQFPVPRTEMHLIRPTVTANRWKSTKSVSCSEQRG